MRIKKAISSTVITISLTISVFVLSLAVNSLSPVLSSQVRAQESAPRNILMIVADDLRNWLGYTEDYAGTIHTPNIDALAAESTRFTNAYTAVPRCPGSRTTAMLGLHPLTHGIIDTNNGANDAGYQATYEDPNITSLPQVLSAGGYHTETAGKIFHYLGNTADRWDIQGPTVDQDFLVDSKKLGPNLTGMTPQVWDESEADHTDQKVLDYSKNFINTYSNPKPFFFAAGFFTPHVQWNIPQWAYDMYPIDDVVTHYPKHLPQISGSIKPSETTTVTGQEYTFYGRVSSPEFLTEVIAGDRIYVNDESRVVTEVISNTELIVDRPFTDYTLDHYSMIIPSDHDLYDESDLAINMALKPNTNIGFGPIPVDSLVGGSNGDLRSEYTQAYLAAITYMDHLVGQLLDELDSSKFAGNTDVVFWSDHGFSMGEKNHWAKTDIWEDTIKVPLLVKSPGNPHYPVGEVNRVATLLDLAPSIVDLAGLPPEPQFEGNPFYVDDKFNAEIYTGTARAEVMNSGWKIVDYDRNTQSGWKDLGIYWQELNPTETANVACPIISSIFNLDSSYCENNKIFE